MPFIPLTPAEEKEMLLEIGVQTTEDLFATIPPKIRESGPFDLSFAASGSDRGLTEHEIRAYFSNLAARNYQKTHFLGGGVYDNIIPAVVNQLVLRGEFLTCYTPYQPEMSQGTLQAVFEFQTLLARITGMECANASMYDGATATAEACLMAQRLSRQKRQLILVAESLHPDYRAVVETFLKSNSIPPVGVPWDTHGEIDLDALSSMVQKTNPCALVIPSPNYFGIIEKLDRLRSQLPSECYLIVVVTDPSSLGLFEPPGRMGADIVVGEAQQLGTPMSFGGPHVGFFACKKEYIRQMPGRLVGETIDEKGRRAYALTLATREQHIRREKATSNICTNQGLMALRTTIYLSFLGKRGFQKLSEVNYSLFDYLRTELGRHGIPLRFPNALHYREGVFEVPNLQLRMGKAIEENIMPGISLGKHFAKDRSDLSECLLICVHPKHKKRDLDALVEVISHD